MEYRCKVCMLGDPAVGKTSLVQKYVYNVFSDKYLSTLGTKVSKKVVQVNEDTSVQMMIWDLAGQKEFQYVHFSAFQNSAAALVVADVTRRRTFENLKGWIRGLISVTGDIPLVILANKVDIDPSEYDVEEGSIERFSSTLGVPHFYTSAKTGESVERAFEVLARMLSDASYAPEPGVRPGSLENIGQKINRFEDMARMERELGLSAPEIEGEEEPENLIVKLEDRIIYCFTQQVGEEFGMILVNKTFEQRGVDFKKAKYGQVVEIAFHLYDLVAEFNGKESADKYGRGISLHMSKYKKMKDEGKIE